MYPPACSSCQRVAAASATHVVAADSVRGLYVAAKQQRALDAPFSASVALLGWLLKDESKEQTECIKSALYGWKTRRLFELCNANAFRRPPHLVGHHGLVARDGVAHARRRRGSVAALGLANVPSTTSGRRSSGNSIFCTKGRELGRSDHVGATTQHTKGRLNAAPTHCCSCRPTSQCPSMKKGASGSGGSCTIFPGERSEVSAPR